MKDLTSETEEFKLHVETDENGTTKFMFQTALTQIALLILRV